MHLFLLCKIFILMYLFFQVQVKFKNSDVAGPSKYCQLGEKLAFISLLVYKLLFDTKLHDCTSRQQKGDD